MVTLKRSEPNSAMDLVKWLSRICDVINRNADKAFL